MKNQEAFYRATIIYDTLTTGKDLTIKFNSKNVEWIIKAAEALEKQIPKKVEWTMDYSLGVPKHQPVCPCCKDYLIRIEFFGEDDKTSYCDVCGNAIDWNENNEVD